MYDFLKGTTPTGMRCMLLMSVGGFLFGFDNGWWGTILGAQQFLKDYGSCTITDGVEVCSLSASKLSAGSSVQSGGIMIGCLFAVYINNLLGRRYALVTTGIISIAGVIIELTSAIGSPRFIQFVLGKVVASVAMGLAANIVPVYLSETSTGSARGFAVSMYQNVMIIGVIIASGTVFASSKRQDAGCYLIPMGVQLIAPICMVTLTPTLPESPRWLMRKGRREDAGASAWKLFGSETNGFCKEDFIRHIHASVEEDIIMERSSSWKDLFRGPTLRRLLIAVGIQSLQQGQGSSYMNNYIVSFLQSMGITNVFPYTLGVNVVYYVGILSGHVLPDKFGRRGVLMSTASVCGVSLLVVASIITAMPTPNGQARLASIVLIYIWWVVFGAQSPLIWITTAEAAPSRNRERVQALAIFFGFGVSLLIAGVSPYIQNEGYGNLGGRIGYIWGSFSIITVIWVYFVLPEMRGFTLEQLDYLYDHHVPTRKFASYKFEETLEDLVEVGTDDKKLHSHVEVTSPE